MDLRYGVMNHEWTMGTLVSFDQDSGHGFLHCEKFEDPALLRESEILFPCGPYNIPTDGISKNAQPGDVYAAHLVETQNGLIALGAVHKGTVDDIDPNFINDNPVWSTVVFPRFVGIVTHWNFQKCYGFISCDSIRPQVFLQKKEFLIPYEVTSDPYQAIIMSPKAHDRVTFDTIETPRGIRALGVKKWKGE